MVAEETRSTGLAEGGSSQASLTAVVAGEAGFIREEGAVGTDVGADSLHNCDWAGCGASAVVEELTGQAGDAVVCGAHAGGAGGGAGQTAALTEVSTGGAVADALVLEEDEA